MKGAYIMNKDKIEELIAASKLGELLHKKEEEEEKNFSEAEQKKKEKQESLLMAGTVAFSIVAAVAIFMVLPYFLSSLMKPVVPSYHFS